MKDNDSMSQISALEEVKEDEQEFVSQVTPNVTNFGDIVDKINKNDDDTPKLLDVDDEEITVPINRFAYESFIEHKSSSIELKDSDDVSPSLPDKVEINQPSSGEKLATEESKTMPEIDLIETSG